jgi:hypothetical protein
MPREVVKHVRERQKQVRQFAKTMAGVFAITRRGPPSGGDFLIGGYIPGNNRIDQLLVGEKRQYPAA